MEKALSLLKKVRRKAPKVAWPKSDIPKLWFEKSHGRDSLVVGNQTGEIWLAIANDSYWLKSTGFWERRCELVLEVAENALAVRNIRSPLKYDSICSSRDERNPSAIWVYDTGTKEYPVKYKAHVDAMLLEAAKRFGWEIKHV